MPKNKRNRIAIITVAGISSRFNQDIPENQKTLKAIYSDCPDGHTLLSHLVKQCGYADRIIIVGGYKYDDLRRYLEKSLKTMSDKIMLVQNTHFADLASGYSFYLGLTAAFQEKEIQDILFVEGDLDIDDASFQSVVASKHTVLTDTNEIIEASKSVVFYKNTDGKFRYAFNSQHGFLQIDEPFSVIMNSGQLWKFHDADTLKKANETFFISDKGGTNLSIIQMYLDNVPQDRVEIVKLQKWTNCNTREDYKKIKKRWEGQG